MILSTFRRIINFLVRHEIQLGYYKSNLEEEDWLLFCSYPCALKILDKKYFWGFYYYELKTLLEYLREI